jgi:hypothetical protein
LLAGLFGSAFVPVAQGARVGTDDPTPPKASLTVLTTGTALDDNAAGTAFGFLSDDADETLASADVVLKVAINSAGNEDLESADLKAVSSNDDILVAWLYTDAAGQSDGAAGDGETAAALDCADMDGTNGAGGNELAIDAFAATDIVESAPDHGTGAGLYWLCIAAAEDDTAATSTITISAQEAGESDAAGFVTLKSVTVTAIGPTDAITLSITDGYKYVAEENTALEGWLTILCRDENGTLINDATASISAGNSCGTVVEDSLNPKNADNTAIDFVDITTGGGGTGHAPTAPATGANAGSLRLYHLQNQACNTETDADLTDAGNSYSLKVAVGTVKSNAITITCTGVSADARVTRIYAEATTGGSTYNETATGSDDFLSLFAVVVDEDGTPLGDGAATQDFDWSIDGATAIEDEFTDNGTEVAVGGEIELGTLCETITDGACTAGIIFGRNGRFTYSVAAANSDLTETTAVELEVELTYTAVGEDDVAISQTRNAAKTRATIAADMGESNAFERIEFTVELANGTVKTFIRRANASGVATLVQSRRKTTVYVYADVEDGGGSPTDVLKVVFK